MRRARVLAVALLSVALACTGTGGTEVTPTSTDQPAPTAVSTVASEGRAPSTLTPAPKATSTATPPTPWRPPVLSEPPPPLPPREQVVLPVRPQSPFSEWDGKSVVVYDLIDRVESDFGLGSHVTLSPGEHALAWVSEESRDLELRILNLSSWQVRSLGPARTVKWIDDRTVEVRLPISDRIELVDIQTGERTRPVPSVDGGQGNQVQQESDLTLVRIGRDRWRAEYQVFDLQGRSPPLIFEAYQATLAPDATLFVATVPPQPYMAAEGASDTEEGLLSILAVDFLSRSTVRLTSALATAPNWRFVASTTHLAWNERRCGHDPALSSIVLFDRTRREATAIDFGEPVWLEALLGEDRMAVSRFGFGADAIVDIAKREYLVVLPRNVSRVVWTSDSRFAAVGRPLGHGGVC